MTIYPLTDCLADVLWTVTRTNIPIHLALYLSILSAKNALDNMKSPDIFQPVSPPYSVTYSQPERQASCQRLIVN